jgi:hypothetical protein
MSEISWTRVGTEGKVTKIPPTKVGKLHGLLLRLVG